MVRRWFFGVLLVVIALEVLAAIYWPPGLWSLAVVIPLAIVGLYDSFQRERTILRNFPVIGHARYLLEHVRPEIQQYFIESNVDAYPIERELRSVVYQRAKNVLETVPFGTQRNVYEVGYEWASHSLRHVDPLHEEPRVLVGGPDCTKPYSSSRLNISAMSFGSLSPAAIRALNLGAKRGGFAHNTGEGGISPYHEQGGDLIWQIGTGYFGCRDKDGRFSEPMFQDKANRDAVKMIEIKLSQGAKPGHGGILPAAKVTREIADIRGVAMGEAVISPPWHSAFDGPTGLLEFVARLRELAGGKPVGFKICIGRRSEFLSICKAMVATGITPDFISVDGGEGGTGAAPLEFSNSIGMPARDGWEFVNGALKGFGVRDRIRLFCAGKIITGFHMVRANALGADVCYSARGMMLALGCIQALRCNTDACPTGVATQNPALYKGLVVPTKAERVFNFHRGTIRAYLELIAAMGLARPEDISPEHLSRRVDDDRVRSFRDLYDIVEPGQLLTVEGVPQDLRRDWEAASPEVFA
jgi:glutamate synthase domain-containing protein 2